MQSYTAVYPKEETSERITNSRRTVPGEGGYLSIVAF